MSSCTLAKELCLAAQYLCGSGDAVLMAAVQAHRDPRDLVDTAARGRRSSQHSATGAAAA